MIGGESDDSNSLVDEYVDWVMRYDVSNDMWFKMPNMITGRYCPGVFISKGDNRFLYAFGGLVSTIERIDVGGSDNIKKWEMIDCTLPKSLVAT